MSGLRRKTQEKSRFLAALGMTNYLRPAEMRRSSAAPLREKDRPKREEQPKSRVRSDRAPGNAERRKRGGARESLRPEGLSYKGEKDARGEGRARRRAR